MKLALEEKFELLAKEFLEELRGVDCDYEEFAEGLRIAQEEIAFELSMVHEELRLK